MGFIISQQVMIRSDTKSKKTNYIRMSFPPNYEKADRYFNGMTEVQVSKMSSKEMRNFLRTRCKKPIKDRHGLPYCYRVMWVGGNKGIRTLFPNTKGGEKIGVHGRLDYDAMMAAQHALTAKQ